MDDKVKDVRDMSIEELLKESVKINRRISRDQRHHIIERAKAHQRVKKHVALYGDVLRELYGK